jgi:sulfate permease, SulP family
MRRAANELLGIDAMRGRRSIVDARTSSTDLPNYYPRDIEDLEEQQQEYFSVASSSYGAVVSASAGADDYDYYASRPDSAIASTAIDLPLEVPIHNHQQQSNKHPDSSSSQGLTQLIQQASAVAVICLLNIMVAIPFGASYFPVYWGSSSNGDEAEDVKDFPLQHKEALGIRMFLFATISGQIIFTIFSKFTNPVALQMVENVPFLHALAYIVNQEQGYGKEALSTLIFLYGFSSVIVGIVFYALGKLELGRLVYFFPNHVLIGCIGGIGVFMIITSMEVTNDASLSLNQDGIQTMKDHWHLWSVVVGLEAFLRLLMWATQDKKGRPKFQLLSPLFYCLITPGFYLALNVFGVSKETASDMGYFFPAAAQSEPAMGGASVNWLADDHLWDIFQIVDLESVSWRAVFHSTSTIIALAAFSLIHVPINIPAFAISTDVDTDMNAELIAHGFSNALSGMFGGLQNYLCYSNSALYAKTGGGGKVSSLAIVVVSSALFLIGPSIVSYLPRCIAGTLLLHLGVDLILEGVVDSFGNYDQLEYAGIWLITVVMTVYGMDAALIAGVIAALSTYAFQSINFNNPIRLILTATSLRSSVWNRDAASRAILDDDKTGRSRILIFQLQGHLFFGNIAQLSDTIKEVLKEKNRTNETPIVVVIDFTLVVGMDSSAAHAVAKLKKIIHRLFHIEVSIFVTGSGRGGFPCEFALSQALFPQAQDQEEEFELEWKDNTRDKRAKRASSVTRSSVSVTPGTAAFVASRALRPPDGQVCESVDEALIFAEDVLITRADPTISSPNDRVAEAEDCGSLNITLDEERFLSRKFLKELFGGSDAAMDIMLSFLERQEYFKGEYIWQQGTESDCTKLLVHGNLLSYIEGTDTSEIVRRGNFVGELGLVHGTKRLTTLVCHTDRAILYNLNMSAWQKLKRDHPEVSRLFDDIVILYLAHRVQHVSNRYFGGSTLPV